MGNPTRLRHRPRPCHSGRSTSQHLGQQRDRRSDLRRLGRKVRQRGQRLQGLRLYRVRGLHLAARHPRVSLHRAHDATLWGS